MCTGGIFYFGYDWNPRLRGAHRYCGKKTLNFQSRNFTPNNEPYLVIGIYHLVILNYFICF